MHRNTRRIVGTAAIGVLAAATMAAGGPPKDIVNGDAQFNNQAIVVQSQTLGRDTTDARGSWTFSDGTTVWSGTVTTLEVDGSLALLCGTMSDGRPFTQFVNDLTNGVKEDGTADESRSFVGSDFCDTHDPADLVHTGIRNTGGTWTVKDS